MKSHPVPHFLLAAWLACLTAPAHAEHRATHLGHPATRFAPTLTAPEQLRALLTDDKMRSDVLSILQQAGWPGDVEDLRRAAAVAPITDLNLPVGTRMPFMSSRKNGKPVTLMDVVWAGKEPVGAYSFDFSSRQHRYRCITPKPCSNFYVVDLGEAAPDLAIQCSAPGEILVGRHYDVCLTATNQGTWTEFGALFRIQIPAGTTLVQAPEAVAQLGDAYAWTIPVLPPATARQVCLTLVSTEAATLGFNTSAQRTNGMMTVSRCETRIAGIPAILLETSDLEDPIEVGKQVVYEIKVTNQGTAPGTNLKVECAIPESEEFVSGTGTTPVHGQERSVTMDPLPVLAPKAQATWHVTVKALKPDDARFKVSIRSDQFQEPIHKDEATQLY